MHQTSSSEESQPAAQATVCQVLHTLNIGGAEVLAARLARNLSGRFRVVFACLDELGTLGSELRKEGFTVEVMGRKSGFDLSCVRRLAQFFQTERVNVVHAHQYTPFFYSRAPGVMHRRPPVIFNEHGRFYPDHPNPKRMVFNRLFLRPRDRVVSVGEGVRQALIDNEGIPGHRVQVIYNGIDLDRSPIGVDRVVVRGEMQVDEDDFVVLQVARLDPIKDHLTALKAIAQAAERCPKIRLVIVGGGPERDNIEAEITARQLEPYIRMLGERSDVPRLLAAADAFLLTSLSEGIPVTLIEAMGAELPIVSTAAGGVGEVVLDRGTGLLADVSDDAALCDALCRLAQDSDLRNRLGRAGRERALEMFSEPQMHAAYADLYNQMCVG